jgi:WD40 repeat protein
MRCILVEYQKGEDPHLLQTGKFETTSSEGNHVAISPDGLLVVCTTGSSASFFSVETGKCETVIHEIHNGMLINPYWYLENTYNFLGPISCIAFDSTGDQMLTAGDKHIRVFRNVVGAKTKLESLKLSLKTGNLSSTMKDRIQQQIGQLEQFLKTHDI